MIRQRYLRILSRLKNQKKNHNAVNINWFIKELRTFLKVIFQEMN